MGNVQMEAEQIRYKGSDYKNLQTAMDAALENGGSATLEDLTDTDITTPSDGQVLTYDGTAEKWENASPAATSLSDLTDTAITTPTNGQVLTYDSTAAKWGNASVQSGEVYSTTETYIGIYKGQDLYRKVFTNIALGNNTYISFEFTDGIPVFMYGTAHSAGQGYDNYYVIPWYNKGDNQSAFPIYSDISKHISIECIGNLSAMTADIVVEYVKPAANNNSR